MQPITKRITAAFGAGAFGQVSNTLIQLFSLPIFLHYWDVHTYGIWLMYSAIPGYLSMADVGMVQAAGNRMTMEVGVGNHEEANRIFQSAFVFMVMACLGIGLLSYALIFSVPTTPPLTLTDKLTLSTLVTSVLVALFGGLSEAIFKATNRYAMGTMLGNMVRLAEWCGWIIGLIVFRSYLGVALAGLMVRVTGTATLAYLARKNPEGIRWGTQNACKMEIKKSIKPALSFMIFPLSNAFSFQGVTLLAGYLFGPTQVVIFNTYRTLARSAVQVTGVFSNALWAEFATLFGQRQLEKVRRLYKKGATIGSIGATTFSLILILAAPWILNIWTHGRVPLEWATLAVLLVYAAIGGSWHVPRVLLMSTNQHIALSRWSIFSAFLLFGLAYIFGKQFGLIGLGMAMLISEMIIAIICLRLANDVFNVT